MFRQHTRRLLRQGHRGEDVRQVQQLLQEAGHDPGPLDGFFGPRTDAAVRAFQSARQLVVDGIVGPKTWEALTTPSTDGSARGHSLHIGLNVVDDAAYGTPIQPLSGCVNDANSMTALATSQGFSTTTLVDRQGTSQNILDGIAQAAGELRAGDFFLLTYAGHGSQVPDTTGEEGPDALDETWVTYDRQLIDDELAAALGRFQPGVRILVVSDSCHSGSMTRELRLAYQAFAETYRDDPERGFVPNPPASLPVSASRDVTGWADLQESVRAVIPSVVEQVRGTTRTAVRPADVDRYTDLVLAQVRGETRGVSVLHGTPRTRELAVEIARRDVNQRREMYREVKLAAREADPPRAPVLLISGCQDHQLSLDGDRNGLFTQRLLETWDDGRFNGQGYPELHRRIVALMPPQQIPNLFWATPPDPKFELQRPFTI
jgi:hypothetical protein